MGEAKLKRSLPPWTPFEQADHTGWGEADLQAAMKAFGVSREEAERCYREMIDGSEIYLNSRYQVMVRRENTDPAHPVVWLSIKRRDKAPVGVERFRDFQRIKNELCGPDREAIEIYPAEERLVDTSNQYHLWVVDLPGFRWPFGFKERSVVRESHGRAVQQPFEE